MHVSLFRKADSIRDFTTGDVIFAVGDKGDVMYAVVEGNVELKVGNSVVEIVEPGEFFGEMALIDDSPRSATAIAGDSCKLAIVNRDQFVRMVEGTPFFALTVMEKMADRLRRMDQLL